MSEQILPSTNKPTWQEIAATKRASLRAFIPTEWLLPKHLSLSVEEGGPRDVRGIPKESGILDDEELRITEMHVEELLSSLKEGKSTAVAVCRAFCKRAAIAHQLVNCLTEICFDDALARAKELDEVFQSSGPVGLLHGLPVSVKDAINVKGLDSAIGFVAFSGLPEEEDAAIVTLLRQNGAVIYCKTQVPPDCEGCDTNNVAIPDLAVAAFELHDPALLAADRTLSSGGSTGGEGSLISLCGSPLGVGTDNGGSLRFPATISGLCSLKASIARLPSRGCKVLARGFRSVPEVVGPVSKDVYGLEIFCKALLGSESLLDDAMDPSLLPIPWREIQLPKVLNIGIMADNGLHRPQPPILRAVEDVAFAMRAAGHNTKEWSLGAEKISTLRAIVRSFCEVGEDDGEELCRSSGEPNILGRVRSHISGIEVQHLQARQDALRDQVARLWSATSKSTTNNRCMDALIMPVMPIVAYESGEDKVGGMGSYTNAWNFLDYSVVTISVTEVDPTIDLPEKRANFRNAEEEKMHSIYDADKFAGIPIGVQIVCRRLEEEKALAIAKVVVAALEKQKKGRC